MAPVQLDEQLSAILDGSPDEEILLVLGQVPGMDDGMKLVAGMQKLSAAASAFQMLRPLADACTNEGMVHLFNKIGGLSDEQVASDISLVYADDSEKAAALMGHPPELRRRRFYLSLAAGYLE